MSATVRAKFRCDENDPGGSIRLNPVVGGSPENESFYDATPWGSIELGIPSPTTRGMFRLGQEYYVDFTPAHTHAD